MLRSRWFVVGGAILLLGAVYQALVWAIQILALPRFEIPYVEPGSGAGSCIPRFDPDEWVVAAVLALGFSWSPLGQGDPGRDAGLALRAWAPPSRVRVLELRGAVRLRAGRAGHCCARAFRSGRRRHARFLVPVVLGIIAVFNHGTWEPPCSCQVVDVPSVAVAATVLGAYPGVHDASFGPSEAVQLSERALRWNARAFDSVPAFLDALARERDRSRELAVLLRVAPTPARNLVLRFTPGVPLDRLRQVIEGARATGFAGVTFEFGFEPWGLDLGGGLEVPTVHLVRVPVRFAEGCACQLELGAEESVDTWWRRSRDRLAQGACCFSAPAEAVPR